MADEAVRRTTFIALGGAAILVTWWGLNRCGASEKVYTSPAASQVPAASALRPPPPPPVVTQAPAPVPPATASLTPADRGRVQKAIAELRALMRERLTNPRPVSDEECTRQNESYS